MLGTLYILSHLIITSLPWDRHYYCTPFTDEKTGLKKTNYWLPWSPVVKTLSSQCRGREFNPWSGKIPYTTWHSLPHQKKNYLLKVTQLLNSRIWAFRDQLLLVLSPLCCLSWPFWGLCEDIWRGFLVFPKTVHLWDTCKLERARCKYFWKSWSHAWLLSYATLSMFPASYIK